MADDPLCHMLDIDLGDRQKNYKAWAYSPDNGHLSSKAFVELNRKLFDGPLREAGIEIGPIFIRFFFLFFFVV